MHADISFLAHLLMKTKNMAFKRFCVPAVYNLIIAVAVLRVML